MIFPRYRYRYYHYETPSHHSTSFKFSCIFCSVKGWKCSFLQCTPKLITKFSVGWWLGVKEKISNRANQCLQCRIKMCFLMITSPGYLRNSDEKLLHIAKASLQECHSLGIFFCLWNQALQMQYSPGHATKLIFFYSENGLESTRRTVIIIYMWEKGMKFLIDCLKFLHFEYNWIFLWMHGSLWRPLEN